MKSESKNKTSKLNAYKACGQLTSYLQGTNLQTTKSFDDFGFPTSEYKWGQVDNTYAYNTYDFDEIKGNLLSRSNYLPYYKTENFTYDNLNRLTNENVVNGTQFNTTFATNGNITHKSDIGVYDYGDAGPHAVTGLSNTTGSLLPANNQTVDYTAFSKASHISQGNLDSFITYGSDRLRRKTQLNSGIGDDVLLTKYYAIGHYEKEITPTGTRHLHYISGGDGLAAIYVKSDNAPDETYYILKDHLGSITGAISSLTGTVYRQNFDACSVTPGFGEFTKPNPMVELIPPEVRRREGRKRNPVTWSYTNIPDFPFDRGYTGHEHLKWFGLINMNGRMYDAVICRFLSPDPFVQMPDYTQNFNRYSYALNNPLVYSDPSVEFFIWDSWVVGFVHGFFSTGSDKFNMGWSEANHRAGIDAKIWGGLFASDPNRQTFSGQAWEIASRFTWQLPQTIVGMGTAHWTNTVQGKVNWVKYKYGATVVNADVSYPAITQGSYIVGCKELEADANNPLFQHEYGHYIQSQSMGWAYYPRVGIPSIRSEHGNYLQNYPSHNFHPVEQDANRRAFLYFNKNVDGFQDDISHNDDKGWNFSTNPLDVYKTGQGEYINYHNANHLHLLNNIKVSAKWYDHLSWGLLFPVGPMGVGLINAYNYNN